MKYCGQCGAKLEDDARFCGKCGALCQEQTKQPVQPQKPQKKKSPVPLIAGAAVLVAVAAAGFLGFRWYNCPEQQALRAVKAGDYAAAQEAVQGDLEAKKSEKLIGLLTQRIEELESGYEQEQMEYEAVQEELAAMEQMKISAIGEKLEAAKETTYDLYCSRTYETVYLKSSQVQTYWNSVYTVVNTYSWDYDDQGYLIGYSNGYDYSDTDEYDNCTSYFYTYDKNGYITGINIDEDSVSTDLTAIYEDGLLTEYKSTQDSDVMSVQFSYDENGYPSSRVFVDSNGEIESEYNYFYDDNGIMRERTIMIRSQLLTAKFDESGYVCEQTLKLNGEYRYRYFYDFNEHGHLCNSIYYIGDNVEPYSTLEVEYTYDDEGRITEIYLEEDGRYASGSFQGSDTYRTLSLDGYSESYGDMTIVLEYDDDGNLIKRGQYENGELVNETVYTYVALELPLNYQQPNINNPVYMID